MADLALFDFDGTITNADTFMPFIRAAAAPWRLKLGNVVLLPLIVGHKLGVVSPSRARMIAVKFAFCGSNAEAVEQAGRSHARQYLPKVIRPKALERIHWHKKRGDRIVIVSASLNAYLTHWCEEHGLDLICAELEKRNGVMTGRYIGGDCLGPEKANRILKRYQLSTFSTVYAYGDTVDDTEMLNLAHKRYFRWTEATELKSGMSMHETAKLNPDHAGRLRYIGKEDERLAALVAGQT